MTRSLVVLLVLAAVALPVAGAASCGGSGATPSATSATSSSRTVGSSGAGGSGQGGAGSGGSVVAGLVGSGGTTATCGGPPPSDAGTDGATGCEGLEGGVPWTTISAVLSGCVGDVCHVSPGWTQPSLVDVAAYECCDHRSLVAPGDPNASYIINKLEGTGMCLPSRMPANGPPYLSDDDVLLIKRWICEGAPP